MSPGHAPAPGAAGAKLFPIAIGTYSDPAHEDLDVQAEVEAIAGLLAPWGVSLDVWATPMPERGIVEVSARLKDWTTAHPGQPTILYWVGHGSATGMAALACANSPDTPDPRWISAKDFALALQRRKTAGTWAMAIVEACQSGRFIRDVATELVESGRTNLMLIGAAPNGAADLGRIQRTLRSVLTTHYGNGGPIPLRQFFWQVGDALGDGLRPPPVWGWMDDDARLLSVRPTAVGVGLELKDALDAALDTLNPEQAEHFFAKAAAAGFGESGWYFTGRDDQFRAIVEWLHSDATGMLIVTGRPGAGKSALLGYVLVNTWPEVRGVLAAHRLMDDLPEDRRPPEDAFACTVHATGASTREIVDQLGGALEWVPPADELGLAIRIDALMAAAHASPGKTIVVDAVDEAQHPLELARLLRRLAAADVRLVVGTRPSTGDAPDGTGGGRDVLDALRATGPHRTLVEVDRDPEAIAEFVRRRLKTPREGREPIDPDDAERVAQSVRAAIESSGRPGEPDKQFLFGSLAVNEIRAQPELARPERAHALEQLLSGSHADLFDAAARRLSDIAPGFGPLLEALGRARGRGIPANDRLLVTVAGALGGPGKVSSAERDAFLNEAGDYVLIDREDGQIVYRLAHRTFQEHFFVDPATEERDRLIADALMTAVDVRTRGANPYVARYLSRHVASGGQRAWQALAARTPVLDRLDLAAITTDALAAAFGQVALPQAVGGLVTSRHLAAASDAGSRAGLRQLGMARTFGVRSFLPTGDEGDDRTAWSVRSAVLRQQPVHVTLPAGGEVCGVAGLATPDGDSLVTIATVDGRVTLWDPASGERVPASIELRGAQQPVLGSARLADGRWQLLVASDRGVELWDPAAGEPSARFAADHDGPPRAIAAYLTRRDRAPRVVTGGDDGVTRVWDPVTGAAVAELARHHGPVRSIATFRGPDGTDRIATAGLDDLIRIWDPEDPGQPLKELHHQDWVYALCSYEDASGIRLVSGGADGQVRIWDPEQGRRVRSIPLSRQPVRALMAFIRDGAPRLVVGDSDGEIRIYDPATGRELATELTGVGAPVRGLVDCSEADGPPRIASGGAEGLVRVWDPTRRSIPRALAITRTTRAIAAADAGAQLVATGDASGTVRLWTTADGVPAARPRNAHAGGIHAIVRYRSGSIDRLATAGDDAAVRLWRVANGLHADHVLLGHASDVHAIAHYEDAGRGLLATGGDDESIRIWDAGDGERVGAPLRAPGRVKALAAFVHGGRRLLAAVGHGRTVRIWDPARAGLDTELRGHLNWVLAVCPFVDSDGHTSLATGDEDGAVRIWDLDTGESRALAGHDRAVSAIAALPGGRVVTGAVDGVLKVWRPGGEDAAESEIRIGSRVWSLEARADTLFIGVEDGHVVLDLAPSHVATALPA